MTVRISQAVWVRVSERQLDRMEEILAINEAYSALDGGFLSHNCSASIGANAWLHNITPPEALSSVSGGEEVDVSHYGVSAVNVKP